MAKQELNMIPVRHLRNTACQKYARGRGGEVLDSCSRSSLSGYSRSTLGVMPQPRTRPEGIAMFLLISEGSCCILPSVTEKSL